MAHHSTFALCTGLALLLATSSCAVLKDLTGGKPLMGTSSSSQTAAADEDTPKKTRSKTAQAGDEASDEDVDVDVTSAEPAKTFAAIPANMTNTPSDGAPVVIIKAASWCGDGARRPVDWDAKAVKRQYQRFIKKLKKPKYHNIDMIALRELGRFVCKDPGPGRLSWLQNYMQAVANKHGIPAKYQKELVHAAVRLDREDAMKMPHNPPPGTCNTHKRKKNRIEANRAEMLQVGIGCSKPLSTHALLWQIDREFRLESPIALTAWVYAAFGYQTKFGLGVISIDDAEQLDVTQFMRAVHKANIKGTSRALAILQFYLATNAYQRWQKIHREKLGSDYDDLVKVAKQRRAQWWSAYKKHKKATDYALSIEHALASGDKRKLGDCTKRTAANVEAYLQSHNPSNENEVRRALAKPIGVLLTFGAMECHRAVSTPLRTLRYNEILEGLPTARGPRVAAMQAVARAVAELRRNNRRFPIRLRHLVPYSPPRAFGDRTSYSLSGGAGVVASVNKSGNDVTITFDPAARQHPIYKCHTTGRIDRITSSGKVVYERNCVKVGNETVMRQEKPVTITADGANAIKRGTYLTFIRDNRNNSKGAPRRVFKSEKGEVLLSYFGIAL